jgi:hypothetical protein
MSASQKIYYVVIPCLYLLIISQNVAFSQTDDTTATPTYVSVCIGYSSYIDYSDYADIYEGAIHWYQRQNIYINDLTKLGPSTTIDAELYFATSPIVGMGLAYGYTFSTASANYKDNMREVKLHAKIRDTKYLAIVQMNIVSLSNYSFYIRMKPGCFISDFLLEEQVDNGYDPEQNGKDEFHVTGTGLYIETTLGVSHSLWFMIASLETGYRYGHILSYTATYSSANNKLEGMLNTDITQSGFFGLLSLGIEL